MLYPFVKHPITPQASVIGAPLANKQSKETFLGNESTFLGKEDNFFRNGGNLLGKPILTNVTFCRRGVESEFSRSSVGELRQGIREGKETAILTKVLFWWLGVLRSFLGSSLVHLWSLTQRLNTSYKGTES